MSLKPCSYPPDKVRLRSKSLEWCALEHLHRLVLADLLDELLEMRRRSFASKGRLRSNYPPPQAPQSGRLRGVRSRPQGPARFSPSSFETAFAAKETVSDLSALSGFAMPDAANFAMAPVGVASEFNRQ